MSFLTDFEAYFKTQLIFIFSSSNLKAQPPSPGPQSKAHYGKQLLEKRCSQRLSSIIALCGKLLTILCCALKSIKELDLELTAPTKNA